MIKRAQTWGQFLPEIGEPLLAEMQRINELEQQAREARKALNRKLRELYTPTEIMVAKRQANARLMTPAF